MSKLILPINPLAEVKKFIAQIFTLGEQGEIIGAISYPPIQPNKPLIGASLTEIKAKLEQPINTVLTIAQQKGTYSILLRVTELEQLRTELKNAAALQTLHASIAANSVFAKETVSQSVGGNSD